MTAKPRVPIFMRPWFYAWSVGIILTFTYWFDKIILGLDVWPLEVAGIVILFATVAYNFKGYWLARKDLKAAKRQIEIFEQSIRRPWICQTCGLMLGDLGEAMRHAERTGHHGLKATDGK